MKGAVNVSIIITYWNSMSWRTMLFNFFGSQKFFVASKKNSLKICLVHEQWSQWITIPHQKSWVCLHSSTKKGIRMDVSKSESIFFGFFESSLQLWRIKNRVTQYWDNCFCNKLQISGDWLSIFAWAALTTDCTTLRS